MQTVVELNDLQASRAALAEPVGLVPTMGFLHEGHLSLVRAAREQCASVVVSIFVNPTQFGPNEDLAAYPRDLPRDFALLEKEGVDLVWAPTPEVMYPAGYQTWVTVKELTGHLEGALRPGHFQGVTTVVAKLFNATRPHKAFFGQKDAQQVAVIRQMTRDLSYPIAIQVCPIVREADGLAMSSRNIYLNPQERKAAVVLFRSLTTASQLYEQGQREVAPIKAAMEEIFHQEPLARVQYISFADAQTLAEVTELDRPSLVSMAVYVGKTRLIDNQILG
ncbi:MAG TPA: pantoate--beta-alanine ligase [Anaerolineaceae bacterium]|nr:pantoate--beta-alanine ligase [Anaerolineaceae bacterium]